MRAAESTQANGFKDMTGLRFGRLKVVERFTSPYKQAYWLVKCDCGKESVVAGGKLRSGHTQSCGCLRELVSRALETTHGMRSHFIYGRWAAMINRCENPKVAAYKWYGGRGIKVCKRWHKFENFIADMGIPPKGMTIDRINNDGDYEPGNCQWVTHQENCKNRRSSRASR